MQRIDATSCDGRYEKLLMRCSVFLNFFLGFFYWMRSLPKTVSFVVPDE